MLVLIFEIDDGSLIDLGPSFYRHFYGTNCQQGSKWYAYTLLRNEGFVGARMLLEGSWMFVRVRGLSVAARWSAKMLE